MENKRFTMIDEKFVCNNCKKQVSPLGYTARDHCPQCLYSLHVDINPGDRLANCFGNLIPIEIEKSKNDSLKIIYRCSKCNEIKKNKAAIDDNFDEILKIMKTSSMK